MEYVLVDTVYLGDISGSGNGCYYCTGLSESKIQKKDLGIGSGEKGNENG